MAELVSKAEQELREDGTGVAACAVDRRICGTHQQRAGVSEGLAIERGEHGGQRHRHVGAGVAVGHRKHVDLVDVVGAREQAIDAGA